jgi:hypothetical protein
MKTRSNRFLQPLLMTLSLIFVYGSANADDQAGTSETLPMAAKATKPAHVLQNDEGRLSDGTRKNLIRPVFILEGLSSRNSSEKPAQEAATQQTTIELQRLTTLSSMQFYTNFALIQKMLMGKWDEETLKKFSLYDGINLKMMQAYEKQLKENAKWGPFLKMKNTLHQQVYEDLKPLIRKKRKGEKLTAADIEKLKDLDELIFNKIIK